MTGSTILEAREERVDLQRELQKVYMKPLLVHRVNMPGQQKDTPLSQTIFNSVEAALKARFTGRIIAEKMLRSAEGPVMIRLLDGSPEVLKAEAMAVENEHPLGRFVDLDVYDLHGTSLSRNTAGHGPRLCYVCSRPAHVCARSQSHSLEELLEVMAQAVAE